MDHSAVAELVDAIHVALGLRLSVVVLYPPSAGGAPPPIELLAVAEDLPAEPAARPAYLARRAPVGSFEGAAIDLLTPAEFAASPDAVAERIAAAGRVLLDLDGLVARRLARAAAQADLPPRDSTHKEARP